MQHKLFIFLISLLMTFSICSCDVYTYATTQDDIYVETSVDVIHSDISFDVILKYGIPYYRDGALLYYLYRDIYYYPFYYNNYWYVRAYRRPFTHFDHRPYFRPHHYDYRFSPGHYRGFDKPRKPNPQHRTIPNNPPRRNDNYMRPKGSRPSPQPKINRPDSRPRIDSRQEIQRRNNNFNHRR